MENYNNNNSKRTSPTIKASDLDAEEAATTVFQNIEASSVGNRRADSLDILEQAVGNDRPSGTGGGGGGDVHPLLAPASKPKGKKLLLTDVVRQVMKEQHAGAGTGTGTGTITQSLDESNGGSGGRRPSKNPHLPSLPRKRRHVRKISDVRDLLKSTAIHDRNEVIDLGDVLDDAFAEDVFHEDNVGFLPGISKRNDEPRQGTRPEMEPLISSTPTYGSQEGEREDNQTPRRPTGKKESSCSTIYRVLSLIMSKSYIVRFAIPLAILAWILFYIFDDPNLHIPISWKVDLLARKIVTFELARILQFLLVDCLLLSTRSYKVFGPLVTLIAIQAKGWPLILFLWGLIDMALLEGNSAFHGNWLYWTGLKIYATPGSNFLSSPINLQFLLCLIIAGGMTIIKKVYVGIAFGRRQYRTFAGRLDSILADVVLLNEIATLAASAEEIRHEVIDSQMVQQRAKGNRGLDHVKWSSIRKDSTSNDNLFGTGDDEDLDADGRMASDKGFFSSSRNIPIKSMLIPWAEPDSNEDNKVTIKDVLLFRRALNFMDNEYPFGVDFGPASNRDESIVSSMEVFDELCKLSSRDEHHVEMSVLELLAVNENGERDTTKTSALHRLYRPGVDGRLTKLMFVQSCDSLYKRVAYFKASVSNSASLDQMIEGFINGIYDFILLLFLLSVLKFNPWSMLLSITSLLVSFSFAFGQTLSKYVHGMIMIAVFRPYDLGDRVYLAAMGTRESGGFGNGSDSWLVEEINLGETKLRFGATGETAYISNYWLADMRVYNLNRTKPASVRLEVKFHISIFDKDHLKRLEEALKKYVNEHPRRWSSLDFVRCDKIETDNENTIFTLSFRHRLNWQEASSIRLHQSELLQFIMRVSKKFGIDESSPVSRQVLFVGGNLKDGRVNPGEYKANLLMSKNVQSVHDMDPNNPLVRMGTAQTLG